MFVTQTLRDKVDIMLTTLETRARWLRATAERSDAWFLDEAQCWAAERALHVAIECSTDAANEVIDALIMREPGGYTDIIRVLMEEDVVSKEWFSQYEGALAFRDRLVHGYTSISPEEVHTAVHKYAALFAPYVEMVQRYLGIS